MRIRLFCVWTVNIEYVFTDITNTEYEVGKRSIQFCFFSSLFMETERWTLKSRTEKSAVKRRRKIFGNVNWDKILERKTKLFWPIHVDCCCYTIIKSVFLAALTNTWMGYSSCVAQCSSNLSEYQIYTNTPFPTDVHWMFSFSFHIVSNSVCVHNSVTEQLVPITDALFYRSRHIAYNKIHTFSK